MGAVWDCGVVTLVHAYVQCILRKSKTVILSGHNIEAVKEKYVGSQ